MTDLPPTSSPKVPGRGLKILLAVSLALNLAIAGTVAGFALRHHDSEMPPPPVVRDLSFGPFTEALTRDQRRAMLRGFSEKGPGLREMRAQMRGDLDAVLSALRARRFDPAAFRSAVEAQGNRVAERAENGRAALVALVLQMPDAEREIFAERLEKALSRGGKKGERDARDR